MASAMAREYGSVNPAGTYVNDRVGVTSNIMRAEQTDRDRLHSGTGVGHSMLANSGNAAVLGHSSNLNGIKLNSNNNFTNSIG